ncbi:MAG: pyridoxamine 5'-phosphate oxidase family protein [Gammaproteobacteria bacterium]|nr:pyridoxamine 5'-phosphate oxidase family protein [Gammaproteobacteria bacterium]
MSTNSLNVNAIKTKLEHFFLDIDSLILATVTNEGLPEASYTPYVKNDGHYYIFVSELASHTTHLKQSGIASVIFLENNYKGHPHTRKRLNCTCKAAVIEQSNPIFEATMQQMEKKFGKLINTLRSLNDFNLIQLSPQKGNFVAGFGKAFEVTFPLSGEIKHRKPNEL